MFWQPRLFFIRMRDWKPPKALGYKPAASAVPGMTCNFPRTGIIGNIIWEK